MAVLNNILQHLQDRFFNSVVSNRLVYNTCWEDPRIDRQLLNLNSDSEIVMLTSAGCNALNYLLDNPKAIHCVDANPAQNALLEFKKALFLNGHYQLLWNMFGRGYEDRANLIYQQNITDYLSPSARAFWDRHITYFYRTASEGSFYFRGTSGKIALMIHNRIKHKGLYSKALNLLSSKSLEEQTYNFQEVESQLWSAFYKWLIKRNTTMALLGVPSTQREMIEEEHNDGLFTFIQAALKDVFTKLPIRDNYFWRVYITGSYTPFCCPNYLKKKHFEFYRSNVTKINQHTLYLTEFLERNPGNYSHFILLDHQDWLANTHPKLLAAEWDAILDNARPGAKILFRSAGTHCGFLPDFVHDHIQFHTEKTTRLQATDRVGTYGNTFLAEVKT